MFKMKTVIGIRQLSSTFKIPSFKFVNMDYKKKKETYSKENAHMQKFDEKDRSTGFSSDKKSQQVPFDKCKQKKMKSFNGYSISENYNSKNIRKSNEYIQSKKSMKNLDKKRSQSLNLNDNGNEIIFGIFPIIGALNAKRRKIHKFYYKENSEKNERIARIYEMCKSDNIPCHSVSKTFLQSIVGDDAVNQGACLEVSPLPELIVTDVNFKDKFDCVSDNDSVLSIYLDKISDPMNFGAIIRTVSYLGVQALLTSSKYSCPITNIVSKASAGAAEQFPVFKVADEKLFFDSCKQDGWLIASTLPCSKETIDVDKFLPSNKTLLIMGSEGSGISENLLQVSDQFLSIGAAKCSSPFVQSLNVSVATSIFVHSIMSKINNK